MCTTYVCVCLQSQVSSDGMGSPQLELRVIVRHGVGAGNQTWVPAGAVSCCALSPAPCLYILAPLLRAGLIFVVFCWCDMVLL